VNELRAEAVPLSDGAVDATLARRVLQYTRDPAMAVAEFARVARDRVVVVQAAPNNELVEIYNTEAAIARTGRANHGWLLAQTAEMLQSAGFAVELRAVTSMVAGANALELADILARLHFAGHPSIGEMRAATEPYIAERLASTGRLRDDAVMLVARRR
jgi:ubiquinone/menaquinone biosynthesis C-methylase UbiE